MEPSVVDLSHQTPTLITPFDNNNEKLSNLQKCGYGALVDVISTNKNKQLNEKILLNITITGNTVSVGAPGFDAIIELLSQKDDSIKSNTLLSLAALAPTHTSVISTKLGWSKIFPFLNSEVHVSVAQGAAALVANLTTNGDNQKSVVSSGTLKKLTPLLSYKDSIIDRSVIFTFANASFVATGPASGSTTLMSNDVMGLIIKRLESEEDEALLLPFVQALHRLALQESNKALLAVAHPLLIGWAMAVGEELHQCALDTLALLDALGSAQQEGEEGGGGEVESNTTTTPPPPATFAPIPSSANNAPPTTKPVAPARPARSTTPSSQYNTTTSPLKPAAAYPATPISPNNPKPPPRNFNTLPVKNTTPSTAPATPPRAPSPSPAYVPSPILGRPPSPAPYVSPVLGRPPSPLSPAVRSTSPIPLGKPPPPPRNYISAPSPDPLELSPKTQITQASQTSPQPATRLSPPSSPNSNTTPVRPPPFQNKFHAKSTQPVTPSTPSDPVFTSPPPAFRAPSPSSFLQSSKSSPAKPVNTPTKVDRKVTITTTPQPSTEQVETGGEGEKKDEPSKRDLLQRANSSPVGFRPTKRKDSGKAAAGKHSVVSPDDISHIKSLDPNTDPFASVSSRLPKMPILSPRESLKNSSVLLFSRKVSDMSITTNPAKQDPRELRAERAQQAQLLMQHHNAQLLEQQRKQRELEAEQLHRHAEQWTPLRERLCSGDLSEQLKGMEELLELVKGEEIVPAVLGGVLSGLNEALKTVQLEQFKLDSLYVIRCIAPRSPLSEHIVESGVVVTLIESLAALDEHNIFFEGTIEAITLLATHHEKVQDQIQSLNLLDTFATVS